MRPMVAVNAYLAGGLGGASRRGGRVELERDMLRIPSTRDTTLTGWRIVRDVNEKEVSKAVNGSAARLGLRRIS